MASSLEAHFFSIWRAWSCWEGPSPFTLLLLRDKVAARDGHLDPITPANAPRNSTSGLRSWFCGSRSFSCSCMATPVRIIIVRGWNTIFLTYYSLFGYPLLELSHLFFPVLVPGATNMGGSEWSSSTLSLSLSSFCLCY